MLRLVGGHWLEVFNFSIVGSDLDGVLSVLEVVGPFLECGDNGEEFFLINAKIRFGTREFLRHVRDWAKSFVVNLG